MMMMMMIMIDRGDVHASDDPLSVHPKVEVAPIQYRGGGDGAATRVGFFGPQS